MDDLPAMPMSTAWRIMAERTTQAWTSAPHFFLQRRALAGRLLEWLRGAQSRLAEKVTASDILVMACARALAATRRLTAVGRMGALWPHQRSTLAWPSPWKMDWLCRSSATPISSV